MTNDRKGEEAARPSRAGEGIGATKKSRNSNDCSSLLEVGGGVFGIPSAALQTRNCTGIEEKRGFSSPSPPRLNTSPSLGSFFAGRGCARDVGAAAVRECVEGGEHLYRARPCAE